MITTLTWVSIIAGGLLIFLMLVSLISGLDLDFDLDLGDTDIDTDGDSGGLGLIKGVLTFTTVSSWIIKVLLISEKHIGIAIGIGIFSGILALLLLNYLLKLLLKNEENVNWEMADAYNEEGVVYLKIPATDGSGIVNVPIKGTTREIKAKSFTKEEILTGASIVVRGIEGEYLLVEEKN